MTTPQPKPKKPKKRAVYIAPKDRLPRAQSGSAMRWYLEDEQAAPTLPFDDGQ